MIFEKIKYSLKVLFAVVMIVQSGTVMAQENTFKKAIEELRAGYPDLHSLEIVMDLKVYENQNADQAFYADKIYIKKQNENFHYAFGTNEMLLNDHVLLMIDHQLKVISFQNQKKANRDIYKQTFKNLNLDSILNLYEKPEVISTQNSIVQYRVFQKNSVIDQIDIYIDQKNNYVTEISYLYTEGQYVEIKFEVFKKNPQLNKEIFSEKRYLQKEGKNIVGVGSVKNYTISAFSADQAFK